MPKRPSAPRRMTSERPRDPRRHDVRRGVVSHGLTVAAKALQWLLFSLTFSIVLEWVGMTFWWPEQGLAHSRDMLEAEISYLGSDLSQSLVNTDPAGFARTLADKAYYVLFDLTGLERLIRWLRRGPADAEGIQGRIHRWLTPLFEYLVAAAQITQVFSVRLAVLLLATPVFGLFVLAGLVDGLVCRDLRRWGGGRESSFVYHWAKRSAMPLFVISWVLYLALPFSLHPSVVVLSFAVSIALVAGVAANRFKKYL